MADERPLSVTKIVASLGGALLLASFFLPMVSVGDAGDMNRELFGVRDLRKQIEASREMQAVQPLIEPALQEIERFTATPSLKNLSGVAGASREVLDAAASLGAPQAAEMRKASEILGMARLGLWLLPLVGLVQLVSPALSRMRGHAGAPGLVARFVFGLIFALVALMPLLGVEESHQGKIGPAVYALLIGSCLMMGASVFGVTRRNWWAVLLADVAIVVLTGVMIVQLADYLKGTG